MSIKYQIFKAGLSGGPKFVAQVHLKGTYDQKMLVQRMLEAGTGLSRQDIEGALSLLQDTVAAVCREGNKVTLEGFVQFTPALGGTFDNEMDGFLEGRNNLHLTAQISQTFNLDFARKATLEKVLAAEKRPYLLSVEDMDTGSVNSQVTPGSIITLHGQKMKFDTGSTDEGLWVVNAENPQDRVRVGKFQKVTDKEIVFLLPTVNHTTSYIEVASSLETKKIRTGKSETLTVGGGSST